MTRRTGVAQRDEGDELGVPAVGETEPLTDVLGVGVGFGTLGGLLIAATASTSANALSTTAVAAFSRELHVTGPFSRTAAVASTPPRHTRSTGRTT
jgi:hypothetical protein